MNDGRPFPGWRVVHLVGDPAAIRGEVRIEGNCILPAQRPDRAVRQVKESQARARPIIRLGRRRMGENNGIAMG